MSNFYEEQVLNVRHWTDRLFSFTTTRNAAFRFENGQFAMVGLVVDGKPLVRAYSMASPNYDDKLEWFSIIVPNGPLTSRLQKIKAGDQVLVSKKPVGTLVIDSLTPARNLYLLCTGTGLAPFLSIIADPNVYERFEKVVLIHGCRFIDDLAYADEISDILPKNEFIGEMVKQQLIYIPTVTREPFKNEGRITHLVESGQLAQKTDLPDLSPEHDRVMMCGSPNLLADMNPILQERGFKEGAGNAPADYVIEKAFVDR
ncbi:MAG: ferredoxin--NADP reductase [Hyphomicrobiaceae bacterium]